MGGIMTLRLKEGGYYLNRLGHKVGPIVANQDNINTHPWFCDPWYYTRDGRIYLGQGHDCDLFAEWQDEPSEPQAPTSYWIVVHALESGALRFPAKAPVRHLVEQEAVKEAERLSRKEGGKFLVLKAIAAAENTPRVTVYQAQF